MVFLKLAYFLKFLSTGTSSSTSSPPVTTGMGLLEGNKTSALQITKKADIKGKELKRNW